VIVFRNKSNKNNLNNLPNNRPLRVNERIQSKELQVIGAEDENLGILSLSNALQKAEEEGLDLIEIAPGAHPPVAKIMDYGKYQYEQKKKLQKAKAKAHSVETKTIQVKPGTGEHDLRLKAKKISEWIKKGNRVKVDLYLRGRAKYMDNKFLEGRLERVLQYISEEYKVADGPKKSPKGLSVVIEKG